MARKKETLECGPDECWFRFKIPTDLRDQLTIIYSWKKLSFRKGFEEVITKYVEENEDSMHEIIEEYFPKKDKLDLLAELVKAQVGPEAAEELFGPNKEILKSLQSPPPHIAKSEMEGESADWYLKIFDWADGKAPVIKSRLDLFKKALNLLMESVIEDEAGIDPIIARKEAEKEAMKTNVFD